jgi:hypothetical protein
MSGDYPTTFLLQRYKSAPGYSIDSGSVASTPSYDDD